RKERHYWRHHFNAIGPGNYGVVSAAAADRCGEITDRIVVERVVGDAVDQAAATDVAAGTSAELRVVRQSVQVTAVSVGVHRRHRALPGRVAGHEVDAAGNTAGLAIGRRRAGQQPQV